MRGLRVVGLAEDGAFVVCEDSNGERFKLPADEQLRAASRGDATRLGQIAIELDAQMRPREIQARIRAGESVEHVAHVSSIPVQRVERFAYPVLLERVRTAELAQQAHPVREDGPDVQTLTEMTAYAFGQWGQDYASASWDSWRGDDGRWVVQLSWKAGRSENRAHWAFAPGAHGGTVTPLDEHAEHVMDPRSSRGLRTVGSPVQLPAKSKTRETEILAKESEQQTALPPQAPRRAIAQRSVAQRQSMPAYFDEQSVDESEEDTVDPESLWYAEPIPVGDPILQPPVELVIDPVDEEPEPPEETPQAVRTKQVEQPAPEPSPSAQSQQQAKPEPPRPAQPERRPVQTPAAARNTAAEQPTLDQQEPAEQSKADTEPKKAPARAPKRGKKNHPAVPSWEDVLLGVRSNR